ncbi:hypothetical protein LCGC14_3112100, partial [marine sediment metagenome]
PQQWRNAAVTAVNFSRPGIGVDRPVKVSVTVANTGVGTIEPESVELTVDGQQGEARPVGKIAEGASASVVFEHRFKQSGPHIIRAIVHCTDDLPGDDSMVRVVNILRTLGVLVIEGERSTRPLGSDAAFLRVALAPPPEEPEETGADGPQDLIRAEVIPAAEVASVKQFDKYRVVILADVPRLPKATADAIAEFVRAGGGLLIAPGEKADKAFYNSWMGADQKRLTGLQLIECKPLAAAGPDRAEQFAHVAPNTIDHPGMKLLADPTVSDLASARIRRRWIVEPDDEAQVAVGAALDNGEPFLIQRTLGRGFVLTLTVPLDEKCADLPLHKCYVPMVHELVYY